MRQEPDDIEGYGLENYKSIKRTDRIDIGGLGLILGRNSSGKTNLIEPLLLMKQSAAQNVAPLKINGEEIDLGEYENIVYRRNFQNKLSISFYFGKNTYKQNTDKEIFCPLCDKEYQDKTWFEKHLKKKHSEKSEILSDLDNYESWHDSYFSDIELKFRFGYDPNSKSIFVEKIQLKNLPKKSEYHVSEISITNEEGQNKLKCFNGAGDEIVEFESPQDISNQELSIKNWADYIREILVAHSNEENVNRFYAMAGVNDTDLLLSDKLKFDEIGDSVSEESINKQEYVSIVFGYIGVLKSIRQLFESFLEDIGHIGPLRSNPRRIYYGPEGSPESVGSKGEDVQELLFSEDQLNNSSIIDLTNQWLNKSGFNCELEVSEVPVGNLYQLNVIEDDLELNITDVGFGLSQVLPIITEAVSLSLSDSSGDESDSFRFWIGGRRSKSNKKLLMVEEPEIHLNPHIEANLGDFFLESSKDDLSFFIETHSEHIINRIQKRVSENADLTDNIQILFVEKEDKASKIREVCFDETGRFKNWPQGFFQEDFEESLEILKNSMSGEYE